MNKNYPNNCVWAKIATTVFNKGTGWVYLVYLYFALNKKYENMARLSDIQITFL